MKKQRKPGYNLVGVLVDAGYYFHQVGWIEFERKLSAATGWDLQLLEVVKSSGSRCSIAGNEDAFFAVHDKDVNKFLSDCYVLGIIPFDEFYFQLNLTEQTEMYPISVKEYLTGGYPMPLQALKTNLDLAREINNDFTELANIILKKF